MILRSGLEGENLAGGPTMAAAILLVRISERGPALCQHEAQKLFERTFTVQILAVVHPSSRAPAWTPSLSGPPG